MIKHRVLSSSIVSIIFAFFLVSCFSLTMVYGNTFTSYKEYREHCMRFASASAINEFTRALAEVRLLHGDVDLEDKTALQVIGELNKQGYVDRSIHFDYQWDPLELTNYVFTSSRFDKLDLTPVNYLRGDVPGSFLKKGLLDEGVQIRWFTLIYLGKRSDSAPLRSLVKAFSLERNSALTENYVELLVMDRYFKAAEKVTKVPSLLIERISQSLQAAQNIDQKAQALFLAVTYTSLRPEVEIPVVIHQMELDYSLAYFVRLFKSYPSKYLEEFITPFKEGYGDKHHVLVRLFAEFKDNRKCLQALAYAFLNRGKGHFSSIENDIIDTWEKMTGLEFSGDEARFIEWYHSNKPPK